MCLAARRIAETANPSLELDVSILSVLQDLIPVTVVVLIAYESVDVVVGEQFSLAGNHSRTLREIARRGIVCEGHGVERATVGNLLKGNTREQPVVILCSTASQC